MAAPTITAPDLVQFLAICIGANAIEAKDQYEAAIDYLFIRSAFVPAVNMIFEAPQIYANDPLKYNFNVRIPKSNTQQIKLLSSIPINKLVSISAAVSASSYQNRVSVKYTYISYELVGQK